MNEWMKKKSEWTEQTIAVLKIHKKKFKIFLNPILLQYFTSPHPDLIIV